MPTPDVPERPPYLILCDFAQVLDGKLYMMGAGWTQLIANQPVAIAVAVLWFIPWQETNKRQQVEVALMTEDGQPVVDAEQNPLRIAGEVEVGRPPGARHGASFGTPIAIAMPALVLAPGGYLFELWINGSLEATAPFDAIGGAQ